MVRARRKGDNVKNTSKFSVDLITRDSIVQGYKWVCIHPGYMGGRPALFGKRVSIDFILKSIAGGLSLDELAADYNLPKEALIEALQFAAKLAEDCHREVAG